MKILVDAEGRKVLTSLFDVALKSGGMSNFDAIVKTMDSVEDIPEEKIKTFKKDVKDSEGKPGNNK